jgi:hypothetical protein
MLRRFNYTGRKNIKQEDTPIQLTGDLPVRGFEANLESLTKYELPSTARLFVEAYEAPAYMRFDFGTVGNITPPMKRARLLTEFEGSDAMRFRVKVVDNEHDGQLLAEADGIFPRSLEEGEQDHSPLLPVRSHDLGANVWDLEFPESTQDRIVLLVNVQVGDRTALVRSTSFMSLVWPAILREILNRILLADAQSDLDDDSDWHCQWLRFGRSLLPTPANPPGNPSDNLEETRQWIGDVVGSFCQKQKIMTRFKEVEEAYGSAAQAE